MIAMVIFYDEMVHIIFPSLSNQNTFDVDVLVHEANRCHLQNIHSKSSIYTLLMLNKNDQLIFSQEPTCRKVERSQIVAEFPFLKGFCIPLLSPTLRWEWTCSLRSVSMSLHSGSSTRSRNMRLG